MAGSGTGLHGVPRRKMAMIKHVGAGPLSPPPKVPMAPAAATVSAPHIGVWCEDNERTLFEKHALKKALSKYPAGAAVPLGPDVPLPTAPFGTTHRIKGTATQHWASEQVAARTAQLQPLG